MYSSKSEVCPFVFFQSTSSCYELLFSFFPASMSGSDIARDRKSQLPTVITRRPSCFTSSVLHDNLIYPQDPCMVYVPTLGEKWSHSRGNVGRYPIHGSCGIHIYVYVSCLGGLTAFSTVFLVLVSWVRKDCQYPDCLICLDFNECPCNLLIPTYNNMSM